MAILYYCLEEKAREGTQIVKISKLKKNTILKNGTIIDPLKNFEKKGDIHTFKTAIKAVGNFTS